MSVRENFFGVSSIVTWIIGILAIISSSNVQIIYSIANTVIQNEIGLSVIQVALISAVNMISFSVFQVFSGYIIDLYGIKRILPLSSSLIVLGTFLLLKANNFEVILLSQVFLALGSSFSFVGASYISMKYFSRQMFGFLLGLIQTFYSIFSLLAQYVCIFLMKLQFGWREIVGYAAYFAIIVFVSSVFFIKERSARYLRDRYDIRCDFYEIINCMVQIIRTKDLWPTIIIGSVGFSLFLSLAVLWAPRLLMMLNFTEYQSGVITTLIWLGFALGCPVPSYIASYFKNSKSVLVFFYLMQFVFFVLLLYSQKFYLSCFIMIVLGFASGGHVLSFTIASDMMLKLERDATVISIINACMSIASGVFMWIISLIVDLFQNYNHIRAALLLFIAIIVIMSLLLYFVLQGNKSIVKL